MPPFWVALHVAHVCFCVIQVASMDSSTDNHEAVDLYRSQAKQILKKLNPRSVAKCSIESRPYVFQYV